MASYPALEIRGADSELALAIADDFSPVAAEQDDHGITIYFSNAERRDGACEALRHGFAGAVVSTMDVDDEDWARRSQAGLGPITVGRVTVAPPWAVPVPPGAHPDHPALVIVITPSMGFGTGHHQTTRLCLAALQSLDLAERFVLDVGTGSGILAIAARRLGARECLGVDNDTDAVESARDNLALNPEADHVTFDVADLNHVPLPCADVVTANLTGAHLIASAGTLMSALRPGGVLITSGLLEAERSSVAAAFKDLAAVSEAQEGEWMCLTFRLRKDDGD